MFSSGLLSVIVERMVARTHLRPSFWQFYSRPLCSDGRLCSQLIWLLFPTFIFFHSIGFIWFGLYSVSLGPFKEPVSVVMKLTNITEKKACFKVKTTAPKRYCVKPTTGVIDPKGMVTILVTLQPLGPNDPNEKGKHKFQVLSVLAPETEFNIETLVSTQIWSFYSHSFFTSGYVVGIWFNVTVVHFWRIKAPLTEQLSRFFTASFLVFTEF